MAEASRGALAEGRTATPENSRGDEPLLRSHSRCGSAGCGGRRHPVWALREWPGPEGWGWGWPRLAGTGALRLSWYVGGRGLALFAPRRRSQRAYSALQCCVLRTMVEDLALPPWFRTAALGICFSYFLEYEFVYF